MPDKISYTEMIKLWKANQLKEMPLIKRELVFDPKNERDFNCTKIKFPQIYVSITGKFKHLQLENINNSGTYIITNENGRNVVALCENNFDIDLLDCHTKEEWSAWRYKMRGCTTFAKEEAIFILNFINMELENVN
jgi:hypothetical protein